MAAAVVATAAGVSGVGAATDDALIGDTEAINGVPGTTGVAEATASCPAGQRALGGGIVTVGAAANMALRASGPLDASTEFPATRDGDRPVHWYAAATNESGSPGNFRVYAICAQAKVKIEVKRFEADPGESKSVSVGCPGERRVVGGGVLKSGPAGTDFVRQSGPTDGKGTFGSTDDRNVARRWKTTIHDQGGSAFFKVLAVCSRGSDAKLEVAGGSLASMTGSGDAPANCPGSKRALSGGFLHNRGNDQDFGAMTMGPLDETGNAADTTTGDTPRSWVGGINRIGGNDPARFKVLAICE